MSGAFLREFLLRPGMVGAVALSSHTLSRRMVDLASIRPDHTVVELGPGPGPITKEILPRLSSRNCFFAIELNERFVGSLRAVHPTLDIHQGSASELPACLEKRGKSRCDVVISALPWASFDAKLQEDILTAVSQSLRPGGRMVTNAYLTGRYLPSGKNFFRMLDRHFSKVSVSPIVWRNMPPSVIYVCER